MRLIGVEIIYNLTMKMASSDIGLLALVLYLIFGLKDLGLFIAQIYVVILSSYEFEKQRRHGGYFGF